MTTQAVCKDCGHSIVLSDEKALASGEYQTVWSDDSDWVCKVTGNEHQPGEYAGERDQWGNSICGQDFMAGTICSDEPGHEGGHSATCQNCGEDWYDESCTCERPEDESPMDPAEALTYAILAINTDQAPDATSGNDLLYLELNAERALAALDRIRDFIIASGEDLPDYVFGKADAS